MALLHKFMCCCQLRDGAVVLGWLGLIVQLLSLSVYSAYIEYTETLLTYPEDEYKKMFLAYGLTLTVVSIIAHSMLIWGATTKNRKFMLPWLVSTMVIIVSLFLYVLYLGIVVDILPGLVFVSGFTVIGIILYMWLCILSFYEELNDGGEDAIPMTPIIQEDTS